MITCNICKMFQTSTLTGLSTHLRYKHKIKLIDYEIKFNNLIIEKCKCGNPLKYRSGKVFGKTCGDKSCKKEYYSAQIKKAMSSPSIKEKQKINRLKFMKEHPEKTAWRLGNKMSWPEKYFQLGIRRFKLNENFLITNEKSIFPYYIDFAFENEKVAVEIDGSQHLEKTRKENDIKRDQFLLTKGWKTYRIDAKLLYNIENTNNEIIKLLQFLSQSSFS